MAKGWNWMHTQCGAVTSFVKWITVSTWTQSTSWNHTFTRNVVFPIGVLFPAYFELSSFDQSTPGLPRGRLRTLFRTFLCAVGSLWPTSTASLTLTDSNSPSPAPFKLTQKTNIMGIFKVCVHGFCSHSFLSSEKQCSLARKILEQAPRKAGCKPGTAVNDLRTVGKSFHRSWPQFFQPYRVGWTRDS